MPSSSDNPDRAAQYRSFEVCLRGMLSDATIAELGAERASNDTIVVIRATDRSELHGFIRRVEDLGLELVSVAEKQDE